MAEPLDPVSGRETAPASIEVVRRLNAPAEEVFRAWVDPALLTQWLAEKAYVHPCVDGHFRLETDKPGTVPQPYVYSGDYRAFIPGRRIVATWVYNGPHPEDLGESLITIDLTPIDDRATEMRFREEWTGLADPTGREASRQKWLAAFDRLERVISS
ncbi:MAG TPA: SRPBCC domain-containing protein [Thermomicrobiales bacterium]|nr:SRPBCC domain-containing protein [Thermomicrobiales bacterium]